METSRELLLRKLTGLLKRITDADDDYSVTADQRAALMELESLTWNYPSLQHARERDSSPSHDAKDSADESDDDDDESYYMDIVPYDMTERLKEVNRALVEDPTPAECDRAITIRFREVIADYHSPRDEFPSDSDDGYGDSSDILYDNEDDEGGEIIASLTSGIKEVLGENINDSDNSQKETLNIVSKSQMKLFDVPKLHPYNQVDDSSYCLDISGPQIGPNIPNEKPLLKSAYYHENPARRIESPEIEKICPVISHERKEEINEDVEEDVVNGKSLFHVGFKDESYSGSGASSICDRITQDKIIIDPTDSCSSMLSFTNKTKNEKSELNSTSFEYSDDFEDIQGDSDGGEKNNFQAEKQIPQLSSKDDSSLKENSESACESFIMTKSDAVKERTPCSKETQKHSTLKKDLVTRYTIKTYPVERRKKNSSFEPTKPAAKEKFNSKSKRLDSNSPVIKPALLSSDKLRCKKNNDSSLHKGSLSISASSVSSPLVKSDSSSVSSSTSSSPSLYSVSRSRGRCRTSISGPVRPTSHRSGSNSINRSASSGGGALVQPSNTSSHKSLIVGSSNSSIKSRPQPLARVRKAASASDLHNRAVDEADDRRLQNDKVFRAWLRQKNKQAAQSKKQQMPGGRKTAAEVAERRAQAEEAFQVWLSRKRDQLRLEKKLRGERRRLEDQSRYARTKNECEVAYKEWCRRKRDEVRTTSCSRGSVPRSQSLERPWMQEKTRKLYSAYLTNR